MRNYLLLLSVLTLMSCSAPKFHGNHVIAHRGAWKETGLPQNSLASFKAAAEMGCHGSECDVWLTADDSLVVYHDADRNGKRLDASTYDEVISEPLANGEKIPTLREYIRCSKEYPHTKLIIDLKTSIIPGRTERMVQMIHELVNEMDYEPYVEYLLSYLPAYDVLKNLSDRPIAYLGKYRTTIPQMHPDSIAAYGFRYMDYNYAHYLANPDWVETFKRDGIHLNAWTVNKEEVMRDLLDQGFDYLTTDHPSFLLSIDK